MIAGVVISTAGGGLIWPFLLIYASAKFGLLLSTVAALISMNAGTSLLSSFLAGTFADKIGRKAVMTFNLALNSIAYFFLMRAATYPQFVMLMILVGLSNPLYQVGADAMLADMIPPEKRIDAYAISLIANKRKTICIPSRAWLCVRNVPLNPKPSLGTSNSIEAYADFRLENWKKSRPNGALSPSPTIYENWQPNDCQFFYFLLF